MEFAPQAVFVVVDPMLTADVCWGTVSKSVTGNTVKLLFPKAADAVRAPVIDTELGIARKLRKIVVGVAVTMPQDHICMKAIKGSTQGKNIIKEVVL